ncbi:unnamed protein product, partial [Meganyctiphanes norvegica]
MNNNDTNSLFGDHTRVRSFSDSEDEYDDDPDPEAKRQVEGPDGQEATNDGDEPKKIEPAKVKRVIKNPQPKLDPQRLAGPRGIFQLQKIYKDVKWKGKGYERDDLSLLLKRLEHWAHRLYPKLPFQDTIEQIEKLGMKKNVQVHMKKIRLDMLNEDGNNPEEDDGVQRGPETEEAQPQVDVFDELIGENFSSGPPTATQIFPMPTAPPASAPKPNPTPLTDEQRERLERNKRLAEEKRKARFLQQMEQKQAEANAAATASKGETADGIVELEKEKTERENENSELESTELSLKETENSSGETKTKESDGMEVDDVESHEQKDKTESTTNSSQETHKETENSSGENKTKESDEMEVDDVELHEQKDKTESTTNSSQETHKECTSHPTLESPLESTSESTSDLTVKASKEKKINDDVIIDSGENEEEQKSIKTDICENVDEKNSDELSEKMKTDNESTEL